MPALEAAPPDLAAAELIRRYFDQVCKSCFLWFIYADEMQEHDDRVLALGGIRPVERKTREDAERQVGWTFDVRDSKVSAVRAFASYRDARAAVSRRD